MSHATIVLQAMNAKSIHQADDLATTTRLRECDVQRALNQLEKGGLVEIVGTYYKKKTKKQKYRSKQQELFA